MIKVIRSQHRLNVVAINRSPRDLATHSSDTQTFEGYKIHLSDRVCDTFNHRVSWVIELSLSKPQNYMLDVNKILAVYIVTITNYQNSVFSNSDTKFWIRNLIVMLTWAINSNSSKHNVLNNEVNIYTYSHIYLTALSRLSDDGVVSSLTKRGWLQIIAKCITDHWIV